MPEPEALPTYVARRDALLRRLTDDDHLSGDVADRWFQAWETEAAGRELDSADPAFWIDGHAWIISGVKARRKV